MAMQTDAVTLPQTDAPAETFTKAQRDEAVKTAVAGVQSKADSRLSLTQKQLEAATKTSDEATGKVTRLESTVATLRKVEGLQGNAEEFADYKATTEAGFESIRRDLGQRAMEVTRHELSIEHKVPLEQLMGATTETAMYKAVIDYQAANPPTPETPAVTPTGETPPPATSEGTPATTPPAAPATTPGIDRGGAGSPGAKHQGTGTEKIAEGMMEIPEFASYINSFPDN